MLTQFSERHLFATVERARFRKYFTFMSLQVLDIILVKEGLANASLMTFFALKLQLLKQKPLTTGYFPEIEWLVPAHHAFQIITHLRQLLVKTCFTKDGIAIRTDAAILNGNYHIIADWTLNERFDLCEHLLASF